MAAGDLTTLAAAKSWMNVTVTGDDALLVRLISAVSTYIQTVLNRKLAIASYTETRDGSGTRRFTLTNYPVTAVASLTIDGCLIASYDYVWDQYGITLAGGVFARGAGNVTVAYTAGYATTPVDVEQACLELIALRYARRLRPDVQSKTQGGEAVTYSDAKLLDSVKDVIAQYKRVVQP